MFNFYSYELERTTAWDYGKLRYACKNMGFRLEWNQEFNGWLVYNPDTLNVCALLTKKDTLARAFESIKTRTATDERLALQRIRFIQYIKACNHE